MFGIVHETPGNGPVITHIGASGFRTSQAQYGGGLIVTPQVETDWKPPALADLVISDIVSALEIDPAPEFLLLGTGVSLIHPPIIFTLALDARNVGLEVMDSAAAARAWSMLRSEGRWIVAALYPLG